MQETAFVYNNLFLGNNYGLTISPGLLVFNNIFTGQQTIAIERGIYVDDTNDLSFVDFNLFYNNPLHFSDGVLLGNNNLFDVDPLLKKDHSLRENSPCIDKGCSEFSHGYKKLMISPSDYMGAAPDLGAFEYGITTTLGSRPVMNAGADIVLVAPEQQTTLQGAIVGVGDFDIQWSKVSGDGSVSFSTPQQLRTDVSFSQQGVYELKLTGSNDAFSTSDILFVYVVQDAAKRSFVAGLENDIYLDANDYQFLVGDGAECKGTSVGIGFAAPAPNLGFAQYLISTRDPGTYHVWVRSKGLKDKEHLAVSFNHLQHEEFIRNTEQRDEWQKVAFADVPEGIYPLRIRAMQPGVSWDRIFITCSPQARPRD